MPKPRPSFRPTLVAAGAALAVGLAGCSPQETIEGQALPAVSSPEHFNEAAKQRLSEAGRYAAAIVGCIVAHKGSGAVNIANDQLSNWKQVLGPDSKMNTNDDGPQRVMTNITRSYLGEIEGAWSAEWKAPPTLDGSPGESIDIYVSGMVSRGTVFTTHTRLPDGRLVLGRRQVQAGAPDLEPDRLILKENQAWVTIERRSDGLRYRPSGTLLEPLTPELMDRFGAQSISLADRLLQEAGINPASCELG